MSFHAIQKVIVEAAIRFDVQGVVEGQVRALSPDPGQVRHKDQVAKSLGKK